MKHKGYLVCLITIALIEGVLGFMGFALVLSLVTDSFAVFPGSFSKPSVQVIAFLLCTRIIIFGLLRLGKVHLIVRIAGIMYNKLTGRLDYNSNESMKRFLVADMGAYIAGYNAITTLVAELVVSSFLLFSLFSVGSVGLNQVIYLLLIVIISFLFQLYYRSWLRTNTQDSLRLGAKYQGFLDFIFSEKLYVSFHDSRSNFHKEIGKLGTSYLTLIFQRATFKALVPYIFETIGLLAVVVLIWGSREENLVAVVGIFARLIGSISRISSSHQGIVIYKSLNAEYYGYSKG